MRRFTPAAVADENTPALAGSWEMRRNADEVSAPRDTRTCTCSCASPALNSRHHPSRRRRRRTLVGHWQNGKLVLSHFAGERPNLFEATLRRGRYPRGHAERNRALPGRPQRRSARKGHPEPPDPSRYTNVKDPSTTVSFRVPGSDGKDGVRHRRNGSAQGDDARDRRQLVSELPDEAPFLSELYRDFRARGARSSG